MSAKRLSRREFLSLAGATSGAVLLAACAPKPTEAPVEAPGEAPEGEKIKIIFHAGVAEPTAPGAVVAPGAIRQVAMQNIVDDYMALHPNVEIEFYRFPGSFDELDEWVVARMTAQDMPDVFTHEIGHLWSYINQGWFYEFDDWLEEPNPYQPDYARWRDQFDEEAISSQIGPGGHLYGVAMDGARILLTYNKDHFAEAGITEEPHTWGEFMEVWKKLQANGHYGIGVSSRFHWNMAHLYNPLVWPEFFDYDADENKLLDAKELVVAAQRGQWPNWDAWLKAFQLMKEQAQFYPLGYEGGSLDMHQLFRTGEVSMYFLGVFNQDDYLRSPPDFEMGYLDYPIITKDIWPDAPEKVFTMKGAWGELQYHVPGYLTETAPEKLPVIKDLLMFICQPDYVTACVSEYGMLPLIDGAHGTPEQEPYMTPYDIAIQYQGWKSLSESGVEAERRVAAAYLPTDMSDEELLAMGKEAWEAEVEKVLELNPDWRLE